ncbi:MAG: tetratricopeptide repeat protein [Armatimonadetes bacterium]|nr:tetratricopeptide repeat protein [Armatimonadota bacterium]MDE2206762.1 tetratricopeptide repeat protein [Armatimonadota bacterium]
MSTPPVTHPESDNTAMFCSACGKQNRRDAAYCKHCGAALDAPARANVSEDAFDQALPEAEQVQAVVDRAYRLSRTGDLPGAIEVCRAALRSLPANTSLHAFLGQLYERAGDRQRAIGEYEHVVASNPGSIADRMKLDQLRDGDRVSDPAAAARITAASQPPSRATGRAILVVAAILGVLVLGYAGAAIRLRNLQRHAPAPAAAFNPGRIALNLPGSGTSSTQPGGAPKPATPGGAPPIYIYGPLSGQPVQSPPQPQIRYVPTPAPAPVRLSAVAPPSQPTAPTGTSPDANHVRLESTHGPNGGTLVIPVHGHHAKAPPADPAIIRITVSKPAQGGAQPASGPSSESQSQIAIADDLKMKGNYSGALREYQAALAGASSQRGYVYQQIALTFYRLGDTTSASANYDNAISAYQKQIDSGSNVEVAREGIRVCQTGKKLCGP